MDSFSAYSLDQEYLEKLKREKQKSLNDYIPDNFEPNTVRADEAYYEAMEHLLKPPVGICPESFPTFSKVTGGFRPHEFTVMCGATGTGKTTLVSQISKDFLKQKIPHYVAQVETGYRDHVMRTMSALGDKDYKGEHGHINALKSFDSLYGHHFDKNLILSKYDHKIKAEVLMAEIAYHVKNDGLKFAVVDNFNFFMQIVNPNQAVAEMEKTFHEFIMFVRRVPVHLFMIFHPRKTQGGRVESEFDVKGASSAVQEAQNVFLFNRPKKEAIDNGDVTKFARELYIAKMRERGQFAGRSIFFESKNGVSYEEIGMTEG